MSEWKNSQFLNEAIEEVLSDRSQEENSSVLSIAFEKQQNFILDPERLKALWCTRRAAKSYTDGIYLFYEALNFPGCNCLYIGRSLPDARGIMWKDVLKDIDRKLGLKCQFNETRLTVTLPNGSIIYLTGIDASEDEMNKLLGKKYRLVVLDEASMYRVDLRRLVYGILGPCVADYSGTIVMSGTSGDYTQGLFYDVTRDDGLPREDGWAVHSWTAFDNPHIAKQWQEMLDEIDRKRPKFKLTNLYRQWYLNEWVIDTNKLVYWYKAGRNDIIDVPRFAKGEWQYVLGVDLGYAPDPSAFSLVSFHENDPALYVLQSEEELEMDITDVANKIKWYQAHFNIFAVEIDGSNKQAVMEMRRRHNVELEAAEKKEKADFIMLMNADFTQETIKVLAKKNDALIKQWGKLIWETVGDKIKFPRKEKEGLPNHIADATLYAWRKCYPYLAAPLTKPVNVRSESEWVKYTEKLMAENLERQIERQKAEENEEDFWAISELDNDEDILRHYLNKKKKGG